MKSGVGHTAKTDMIGKRFGKLVVRRLKDISEYENGKRDCLEWFCDCDCGNKDILVKGTELRAGRKTMCSECAKIKHAEDVHNHFFKDITGKRYGKLVAIRPYYDDWKDNDNKSTKWLCQCDCGNMIVTTENHLQRGHVSSCGCLVSKGEDRIRFVLDLYEVPYIQQYKFDDLRNEDTGRRLKFDFAVFKDGQLYLLIEYDGNQHIYGTRFSKDPEVNKRKFERLIRSDEAKNEYCIKNNIRLVRISHHEFDNLYNIIFKLLLEEGLINWQNLK